MNETSLDLRVVIDQCLEHLLLGTVEAGRTGSFRLPARVVTFPEGIRFHAFSSAPGERYGTFALELDAVLADLVLSDSAPRITYEVPLGLAPARKWLGSLSTYVGDDRAYASAFASGTSAVLSWQCVAGEPFLVFTAARRLSANPDVVVSTSGGLEEAFGTWELVRSVSDAAVAPSSVVDPFTRFVLAAAHVTLRASSEEDVPQGHQFTVRGLGIALRELPCFGDTS